MMSVRVVTRQAIENVSVFDPEDQDDGYSLRYDPSDPASVRHAEAALARILGTRNGPALCSVPPRNEFFQRLARLFHGQRPAHTLAPSC